MVYAGYAESSITPECGVPLMGNTREDYRSTGVHDPLYCKALALRSGERVLGILAVDLCMVPAFLSLMIRSRIPDDIPMMICATHTHAGPSVLSLYGAPAAEHTELERIARLCARTFQRALQSLQPASLRFGEAECGGISFCRRLKGIDGSTVMNWEMPDPDSVERPWSIPDRRVRTLEAETRSSRIILVHFPLHPAVLDYSNSLFSRDFPLYLDEGMRQITPGTVRTMFINGCCGDINHIDYTDPEAPRRGYAAAQRIGYALALSAFEAVSKASPAQSDVIDFRCRSVNLKRFEVSQEMIDAAQASAQQGDISDGIPGSQAVTMLSRMKQMQHTPLTASAALFRISDMPFFGLPGEVFSDLKQKLGRSIQTDTFIAAELVNHAIGYIPTEEAFGQGGYETQAGASHIAPGEGERLMDTCRDMYQMLF